MRKMAVLAVLIMVMSVAVVMAAEDTDAATDPDIGSGTASDPYVHYIQQGKSYTLTINSPGTFTMLYGVAPSNSFRIPGMTFESGNGSITVSTISTSGDSMGQLPNVQLAGTPSQAGVWVVKTSNPNGEIYTKIVVSPRATTTGWGSISVTESEGGLGVAMIPTSLLVSNTTITNIKINNDPSWAPDGLGLSEDDWNSTFSLAGVVGKPFVKLTVINMAFQFNLSFTVQLSQGEANLSGKVIVDPAGETFTITFNANGGEIPTSSFRTAATGTGGTLSSLPIVYEPQVSSSHSQYSANVDKITKTYYEFQGWYSARSGGYMITTSTVFMANTTVYAHYEETTTTTYDGKAVLNLHWDGSLQDVENLSTGYQHSVPTSVTHTFTQVPTLQDHRFLGWSKADNADTPTYVNGQTYPFPLGTTDLYAVWVYEPSILEVKFDANGGTGTVETQKIQKGVSIKLPSSGFTNQGKYLAGWSEGSAGALTHELGADYAVQKATTFYAVWEAVPSGADPGAPTKATVNKLYTYTPYNNGEQSPGASTNWVFWVELLRDPSYHVVKDSLPQWLKLETTGSKICLKGTPTAEDVGNNLVKLHIEGARADIPAKSSVTWMITVDEPPAEKFTVSFDANGGTGTMDSMEPVQQKNAVELPSANQSKFSREGYTQVGWQTKDPHGTPVVYFFGAVYTVTKNVTMSAFWVANPNVVVLDANGGTGTIEPYIAYNGDLITLPISGITRAGYTLGGWFEDSEANGVYAKGYLMEVSGAVHMKAYWIPDNAPAYMVTYNANGGAGNLSQTVMSNQMVVLPEHGFDKDGATFKGWSATSDGTLIPAGSLHPVTSDCILYAQYESVLPNVPITFTVVFNANGGVGSYQPQTISEGGSVSEPADPARAGHVFTGWRVVGGGAWDFATKVDRSMTLEAQWSQHFTMTVDGDTLTLTFSDKYAGSNSSIDWGDGSEPQQTNSKEVTHKVKPESSGTAKISTLTSAGTVGSQMSWTASSGAIETELKAEGKVTDNGDGTWTLDASASLGYVSIQWFIDGEICGQTAKVTLEVSEGVHEVILKVSDGERTEQWVGSIDTTADKEGGKITWMTIGFGIVGIVLTILALALCPVAAAIIVPVFIIVGWWLFA